MALSLCSWLDQTKTCLSASLPPSLPSHSLPTFVICGLRSFSSLHESSSQVAVDFFALL